MKLAEEDLPESSGSNRGRVDWVKEVASYQEALRREKLSLLAVPVVREILTDRLLSMHEPSRQRRVNASELVGLISRLRSHRSPPLDGVLASLDQLRLNILWWNVLREAAEKDPSSAGEEWRRCRAILAALAEPLLVAGLLIVRRFVSEQQKPEIQEAIRSDGIIGIYRALERFDPTQNRSFPQYAAYWVRNEIAAGALRSRVVSLTGHSQRKVRREAARFSDGEGAAPCPELYLFSLDTPGSAIDPDEEVATLHEVLPDRKTEPRLAEGKELTQEWLEILRDCPVPLRPFLVLRYYYPAWQVGAGRAVRGAEAFEALAPVARQRLIAGASPKEASDPRDRTLPRDGAGRQR